MPSAKSSRSRILMIAPTPFFSDRGCHIRVLNSYLALSRQGKEVTLVTYPIGRDIAGVKTIRIAKLPGYKKTSPGFSIYRPFLDFLLLLKCRKLLREKKYDSIYGHLHEGALIGVLLRKHVIEVTFDAQGSLTGELIAHGTLSKRNPLVYALNKIEKYILNRSTKIITSTAKLKQHFAQITDNTIEVVEDHPDKKMFSTKIKKAKLNLPKDKKIVVYLGGLQPYKGIDYLLDAIPLTPNKYHFLIMGYPVDHCEKRIKELGIEKRVTLTGKIKYEEAASYLKLGDIAVSPKTLESGEANAKLHLYKAMNIPTVCFDTPENRKILGKLGRYSKSNVKNFANCIGGK